MGVRPIKRVLKNNPFSLLRTQEKKQIAANPEPLGRSHAPRSTVAPWVHAVSLFPPAPAPLPYVIPSEAGHFSASGHERTPSKQPNIAESSKRVKDGELKTRHVRHPPKIRYPEDALRKEFYATHPFELRRPISLVETEESLSDPSLRVKDGESVIRRTMDLIEKEGGSYPLHIAYNISLAEFYTARAGQELAHEQERVKKLAEQREDALAQGREDEAPAKPKQIAWFSEREEEEIANNNNYLDQLKAEQQEKKRVQAQMAQYEARNLKATE
ncbi:mitochondrial ribosomal small subunit component [Phlyctochytrium planicorne]|nr:mitochondrial ribosomal small subunit component [Phlyctochytrium planicorne]